MIQHLQFGLDGLSFCHPDRHQDTAYTALYSPWSKGLGLPSIWVELSNHSHRVWRRELHPHQGSVVFSSLLYQFTSSFLLFPFSFFLLFLCFSLLFLSLISFLPLPPFLHFPLLIVVLASGLSHRQGRDSRPLSLLTPRRVCWSGAGQGQCCHDWKMWGMREPEATSPPLSDPLSSYRRWTRRTT